MSRTGLAGIPDPESGMVDLSKMIIQMVMSRFGGGGGGNEDAGGMFGGNSSTGNAGIGGGSSGNSWFGGSSLNM